ncbi:MAG TPA: OmpH family outer membrane protein [Steroidobacteraceae bacterium]|nr:OmpH family outer membrane protein [Steroidobacteraceae bacterium]
MIKSVLWGAAVACVLATSPAWAELKIGVVNYSRLMSESPQAKAIAAQIRAEFMPRQREIQSEQQSLKTRADKLQRDGATMTEDQRNREEEALRDGDRDLQRKQSELQDDFNARRNEVLSRLQKTLVDEVQSYAKAQSFDLVLADGVIYATSAIDITPAILTRLQTAAKTGTGAAPRAAKSTH